LTDDDKQALVDSIQRADSTSRATAAAAAAAAAQRGPVPLRPPMAITPAVDIPDYLAVFEQPAARGDADGNLWIRTGPRSQAQMAPVWTWSTGKAS